MGLTQMQIKELLDEGLKHQCDGYGPDKVCVRIAAIGELPSRFGSFQVVAFYNNKDDKEHAAFVHGDITNAEDVAVRVHSECLTGDAIGSLRCDCRDQLETSLKMIGQMDKGILLYMRQEGRGSASPIRSVRMDCKIMAMTLWKPILPWAFATMNATMPWLRTCCFR